MHDARRPAGYLLSALSLIPALLVTSWLVVAVPLVAAGQFQATTVIPQAALVCVLVVPWGLTLVRRIGARVQAPWWAVLATVAIAVGFAVFAMLTHSEDIILRRDPGTYAQLGYWYAGHDSWRIPAPLSAFGSSSGQLWYASLGFNQVGTTVVGQFMTGWPTMLAAAYWAHGWAGLLMLPGLIGGCAIMAIGGLVARLVGPAWAPLGALLTAFAWPMLWASQTTLSEPVALLLLAAGACLLVDWIAATKKWDARHPVTDARLLRRIRLHALITGLVLAGGELVRLDFGVDFALVLPVIGWMWLRRRPGVWPFLAGALVGGVLGFIDGAIVTQPYVQINWTSVQVMAALLLVTAVCTAAIAGILRLYDRPVREMRWWRPIPRIGATVLVLIGIALVIRPFVLIDHSTTDPGVANYTSILQAYEGQPIDGSRGYAEQSLRWLSWYLGWPLLIAALPAAAILVRRVLSGRDRRWLPILLMFLGSGLLTLIHPGITPDHPFADRRLVVEAIPGMILLATWSTAAAARWLTRVSVRTEVRWARALPAVAVIALLVAYLWPMGAVTAPMSTQRTELGELAASDQVCQALPANASVVMADTLWMPTVRAQCGLPAAQLLQITPATVAQVSASIRAVGRIPVFVAFDPTPLQAAGVAATQVFDVTVQQDEQLLVQRPDGTAGLDLQFWTAGS
ncbi:MAG TPA: hypothetical protein VG317_16595 [Pseudonocardiaceae bacterium]|nr:hypothetical protein [Pseudonocardiaceae bacterium]